MEEEQLVGEREQRAEKQRADDRVWRGNAQSQIWNEQQEPGKEPGCVENLIAPRQGETRTSVHEFRRPHGKNANIHRVHAGRGPGLSVRRNVIEDRPVRCFHPGREFRTINCGATHPELHHKRQRGSPDNQNDYAHANPA